MIHRDNRKPWESSSSFGQVMWREGPVETTSGDIDHYIHTRFLGNAELLRIIERFQAESRLKPRQEIILKSLDKIIRHSAACPLFNDFKLLEGSGVWVLRGEMAAAKKGHRKVDFVGPQTVSRLDESQKWVANTADNLFSWAVGKTNWTRRDGKPRTKGFISQGPQPTQKISALLAIQQLWQRATPEDQKMIFSWILEQQGNYRAA